MARPNRDLSGQIRDDTFSIHFYGRRMRAFLLEIYDGIPPEESLIGRLVKKHGIDPCAAPIQAKKTNPNAVATGGAESGKK